MFRWQSHECQVLNSDLQNSNPARRKRQNFEIPPNFLQKSLLKRKISATSRSMICVLWRFRNNRFWHNLSFVFMTWTFSLLRKNSIDFFLQFSSIYLSISRLLQFSLNFFNLLQFTSCSKFLSIIFSFFLTSHACLTSNFVEKNLTNGGSHPRQPMSSTVPP